jgi:hypothetical protein
MMLLRNFKMSEVGSGGMRSKVIKALKPLHAIPVENSVHPGTPDVNCLAGWIELKWKRNWPVRPTTPLRLPHFTSTQKRWLLKRHALGGNSWLLLQVKRDWLLFTAPQAYQLVGQATKSELMDGCHRRWKSLDPIGLRQTLLKGPPHHDQSAAHEIQNGPVNLNHWGMPLVDAGAGGQDPDPTG